MNQRSNDGSLQPPISVSKAILLGQLVVNGPVLITMGGVTWGGMLIVPQVWPIFFLVSFVLAWLWWAFTVPRWRKWALRRGAPPGKLQRVAVLTGLTWPKGWVPEKTESTVNE